MEAIKAARKKGYKIPFGNSGYVWSDKTVQYWKAMPGDIAQFVSWHEEHGYSYSMTASHHTAVVIKPYDKANDAVITLDQNPSPVKQTDYHHKWKTGGSMIIYRLPGSKSTRLYEDGEPGADDDELPAGSPNLFVWSVASAGAVVGSLAAVAFGVSRLRKRPQNGVWVAMRVDADEEMVHNAE
jgi:hypothetical protein